MPKRFELHLSRRSWQAQSPQISIFLHSMMRFFLMYIKGVLNVLKRQSTELHDHQPARHVVSPLRAAAGNVRRLDGRAVHGPIPASSARARLDAALGGHGGGMRK